MRTAEGPLFSLQCEPIFDAHPAVRRSGLVGVPGAAHERAVICIERRAEANGQAEDALRAELLALAAAHPLTRPIRDVLFPKTLPVDPRHDSKIERPALARWAAKQLVAGAEPPGVRSKRPFLR